MNRKVFLLTISLVLLGCFDPGRNAPIINKPPEPVKPIVATVDSTKFDAASCSAALAHQAKLLAPSVGVKSSEMLQGVLRHLPDCGAPADYCDRVRKAVPAIESRPPRHLTEEEISTLAGVR